MFLNYYVLLFFCLYLVLLFCLTPGSEFVLIVIGGLFWLIRPQWPIQIITIASGAFSTYPTTGR